jgi:hypothetical protein
MRVGKVKMPRTMRGWDDASSLDKVDVSIASRGRWSILGAALMLGVMLAVLTILASGPAGADEGVNTGNDPGASCVKQPDQVPNLVPRAQVQDADCLNDLTTAHTQDTGHTNKQDWDGLHAEGTNNPTGVPGLQVDGYFPDDSHANSNNGWFHD